MTEWGRLETTVDCSRGPSSQPNYFVIVKLFIGDPGLNTCASTVDGGAGGADKRPPSPFQHNLTPIRKISLIGRYVQCDLVSCRALMFLRMVGYPSSEGLSAEPR